MEGYLTKTYTDLLVEKESSLLWITLNRPEYSNAFSDEMIADLACMCDIRMGCRHSRFGETFAKLALVPGDGGTFFLQRVIGYAKAMELSLTGRIITADEALSVGLLNTIVEEDVLKSETQKLAQSIADNSPVAVSMIKKAIRQARTAEISAHLDLLAAYQGITQRTQDHFEGVKALKEKREPQFKGR
ncbi:MAG: enoyl-CoA hydratase-related protein [Pseudomonadota bacterium]